MLLRRPRHLQRTRRGSGMGDAASVVLREGGGGRRQRQRGGGDGGGGRGGWGGMRVGRHEGELKLSSPADGGCRRFCRSRIAYAKALSLRLRERYAGRAASRGTGEGYRVGRASVEIAVALLQRVVIADVHAKQRRRGGRSWSTERRRWASRCVLRDILSKDVGCGRWARERRRGHSSSVTVVTWFSSEKPGSASSDRSVSNRRASSPRWNLAGRGDTLAYGGGALAASAEKCLRARAR
ncbi:hypothetical protein C8J57DRAFT_1250482 [Mycena rebaudengoi]|nr:hypothetical protein C8J57DRAFT_1250482 [Mycena rebaudengoi]